ncbi:MAG: nitrate transporter substrate-binding protein [Acidobacteria bacterium]|nr:nitrate transporter substrate-binding protein [Acidobacteriota bacterium]
MKAMRKLLAYTFAWIAAITAGHLYLNVNWAVLMNDRLPLSKRKLNVAYIPVT